MEVDIRNLLYKVKDIELASFSKDSKIMFNHPHIMFEPDTTRKSNCYNYHLL